MLQPFKDFPHYLAVFFEVGVIDEDIIHVDRYLPFSYEVCEYRVHKGLEGGRAVGHSKVHYFGFIQSAIGYYCTLPFISFSDTNIVIAPSDIKFGEVSCLCEPIYYVGCEREWITV